jgi:hypothetical protein
VAGGEDAQEHRLAGEPVAEDKATRLRGREAMVCFAAWVWYITGPPESRRRRLRLRLPLAGGAPALTCARLPAGWWWRGRTGIPFTPDQAGAARETEVAVAETRKVGCLVSAFASAALWLWQACSWWHRALYSR